MTKNHLRRFDHVYNTVEHAVVRKSDGIQANMKEKEEDDSGTQSFQRFVCPKKYKIRMIYALESFRTLIYILLQTDFIRKP